MFIHVNGMRILYIMNTILYWLNLTEQSSTSIPVAWCSRWCSKRSSVTAWRKLDHCTGWRRDFNNCSCERTFLGHWQERNADIQKFQQLLLTVISTFTAVNISPMIETEISTCDTVISSTTAATIAAIICEHCQGTEQFINFSIMSDDSNRNAPERRSR